MMAKKVGLSIGIYFLCKHLSGIVRMDIDV